MSWRMMRARAQGAGVALAGVALSAGLVACGGGAPSANSATAGSALKLSPFAQALVDSPHTLRVKIAMQPDGTLAKFTAYVDRAAMPDWIDSRADEHLPPGAVVAYEAEEYGDGAQAFEVTRETTEGRLEASFSPTGDLRYVKRWLSVDAAPAQVRFALRAVEGLVIEVAAYKKGPAADEWQFDGRQGVERVRVRVGPDGRLIARQRQIEADVE